MKRAADHSELLSEQDPVYERPTQVGDGSSNLDDFEDLLAAAERATKSPAGATAAGSEWIGVSQQSFVQSEK
jgi:hypothetical protein